MSLPTMTGTARLVSDPRRGLTKAQDPWANCVIRFVGFRKDPEGRWVEDSSFAATIVAFGDLARTLVEYAKGDEVTVEARLRDLSVWSPKTGDPQAQLSLVALDLRRPDKGTDNRRGATASRQQEPTSWPNVQPARSGQQDRPAAPQQQNARRQPTSVPPDAWPAPGRVTAEDPSATPSTPASPDGPIDLAAYRAGATAKLRRGHASSPRMGHPA